LEYLSPGFIDTISMNKNCEKETVLAAEKELIVMTKQFEEIQKLSGFLDSQKILEVPTHQARLGKLEIVQKQQLVSSNYYAMGCIIYTYDPAILILFLCM